MSRSSVKSGATNLYKALCYIYKKYTICVTSSLETCMSIFAAIISALDPSVTGKPLCEYIKMYYVYISFYIYIWYWDKAQFESLLSGNPLSF